jgi:hypothetical protein
MRKLLLGLASTALILGFTLVAANAQTMSPAAGNFSAIHNASPAIKAGCRGGWGFCPPGRTRVCGNLHCWCRPCY